MNTLGEWNGKIEDTSIEYEVLEVASYGQIEDSSEDDRDSDYEALPNVVDKYDYTMSVFSGIVAGIIDSIFVGDFSLDKAHKWGNDCANIAVRIVAYITGWGKSNQKNPKKYLEDKYHMASDSVESKYGGSKLHHFRDFSHHFSIFGLIFSILSQFTGYAYGIDENGSLKCVKLSTDKYLGKDVIGCVWWGTVKWFFHLISDMAGSSGAKDGGMGIPGPIMSRLTVISSLPCINTLFALNGKNQNFSQIAEQAYLGKLLKGVGFDLRTETGMLLSRAKQSIPILVNQGIIRAYYFVTRFINEIDSIYENNVIDLNEIEYDSFLPKNNDCIKRMVTVSSGVFCAIDLSDAVIRSILNSTKNNRTGQIALRINFANIGNFALCLKKELSDRVNTSNSDEIEYSKYSSLLLGCSEMGIKIDVDGIRKKDLNTLLPLQVLKLGDEIKIVSVACKDGKDFAEKILETVKDGRKDLPLFNAPRGNLLKDALSYLQERINKDKEFFKNLGLNSPDQVLKSLPIPFSDLRDISASGKLRFLKNDANNLCINYNFSPNLCLSSALMYAQKIWGGMDEKKSLMIAVCEELRTNGMKIISSDVCKIGKSLLEKIEEYGLKKIVNAAAKNLIKVMDDANQIFLYAKCGFFTFLTLNEVSKLVRRRISIKQMLKNTTIRALDTFVPMGEIGKEVINALVEDDSAKMIAIIEIEIYKIAKDNLFTENEVLEVVDKCTDKLSDLFLQKMYASKNKEEYAKRVIRPAVDDILFKRRIIQTVSNNSIARATEELISEAVDTMEQELEGYGSFAEIKKAYWNHENEACCPHCGAVLGGFGYVKCIYCTNIVETE